jgi:hypothetical protein
MRQILGPITSASSSEPIAADPFHHQALKPSRYACPVAPIVEPAPIFAASTVENNNGAVSRRPATKKSPALFT